METFANYILAEKDSLKKMEIVYYMRNKENIFFNKTVVLKMELAKMFIETMGIDNVDKNVLLTACLLYSCKKTDSAQELEKIRAYAKESAEYLETLGFSEEICRICKAHNRYEDIMPRPIESDILELVDQFGGMILNRPERIGLKVDEAICLLENRNLKGKHNVWLEKFKEFVEKSEEILVEYRLRAGQSISILQLLANEINTSGSTIEAIYRISVIREAVINKKYNIDNKEE